MDVVVVVVIDAASVVVGVVFNVAELYVVVSIRKKPRIDCCVVVIFVAGVAVLVFDVALVVVVLVFKRAGGVVWAVWKNRRIDCTPRVPSLVLSFTLWSKAGFHVFIHCQSPVEVGSCS